jgi:tyrosine-protein kinase Etk/Wzc
MTETTQQARPPTPQAADEISLIDLLIVLAKHNRLIARVTLGAAFIALVSSVLMPNIYTATATILPPQQNQSASTALLGQLGPLAGVGGGALGLKNPNDLYIGMLKSRTVADNIIRHFDLQKMYDEHTWVGTRMKLARASQISSGKDNIITIAVDDKDKKHAAVIANAYIDELARLNQTLAVTEAARRRLFFEKQLRQAKDDLANAEVALKTTQEESGLIQPDEQGRAIIGAVAKLRAEIAAKNVQLGAMGTFATTQNADYVRTQQELTGLKEQLAKLEKPGNGDIIHKGDIFVPTGKVPATGMAYVRKVRDVKYYETIFDLLAKQYELAKIDEARDSSIIQVLDQAVEPETKSRPHRAIIVLLSAIAAGILSIIWAFIREAGERTRSNPERVERMQLLRRYLWGK